MSTNANINVKHRGKYYSIYLHWDGYPSHALQTLKEHYYDEEKAMTLIVLGDLSILAPRTVPTSHANHNFDSYEKDVCLAYGRDRGEDGTKASINERPQTDQTYNYLFEDGEWKVL